MLKDAALLQWYTGLASSLHHTQGELSTPEAYKTNNAVSSLDTTTGHTKTSQASLEGGQTGTTSTTQSTTQSTTTKPKAPSEYLKEKVDGHCSFVGSTNESILVEL